MVDITLLSNLNPWWRDGEEIENDERVREYLSRKHRLKIELEPRNLLIVGPRQVGKTTSLKLKIFDLIKNGTNPKNIFFFSCEMLSKKEEIIEAIQEFDRLAVGKKYVFLDEISFVKEWQNAVKFLLDSPISRDKTIYITGSSTAGLKKEMFPGRDIEIKKFLPLLFREFCALFGSEKLKEHLKSKVISLSETGVYYSFMPFADELASLFEKYLFCGGFPLSMYGLMENGSIGEKVFDTYFNWIVSDMAKLERSERIFTSVIQGVVKNYGSKFSLNSIAKEMEIGSHVTVRDYLELLEELYVVRSFFQKKRERPAYRSERKAYFIDPFLYRVFYRRFFGTYEVPYERLPHLVEGIVGEHLRRTFEDVYFFSGKKEIDFIVKDAGIEVKYGTASERDFPKSDMKTKIILSKNEFKTTKEVMIVPIYIFLATL
ncbi:MAG: ATP-binding protein [Euryarchaeota archaeon]|nr:ATP-binding protein [Euryarchaeota archaeon]MBU4491483.1 ATP-binding protein [Euryarchaeota archaeon]MCG2728098.1 ATP-binding protein [Candidatus Methanoperedenaceae archaeon]